MSCNMHMCMCMCMCMCACACACTTLLAQRAHDPHSHTLVYFFQACCWNIRVAFSFFWQGGRTSGIGLLLPSLFSPIFLLAQILVSTDLGPRAHLAATACLHSLTGDHSQQSTSDWFCDSWQEFARNPIEVTVVVFLQFPM